MKRIHSAETEPENLRSDRHVRQQKKSRMAGLKEAAEEKSAAVTTAERFTLEELCRFNVECDHREKGYQEPDWLEYKRTIADSSVSDLNS